MNAFFYNYVAINMISKMRKFDTCWYRRGLGLVFKNNKEKEWIGISI